MKKIQRDITKICNSYDKIGISNEKIAIITQIWHSVKYYCTCISSSWNLIMVPNRKKNLSRYHGDCHGGMREKRLTDRLMDGWLDRLDPFGKFPVFSDSTYGVGNNNAYCDICNLY